MQGSEIVIVSQFSVLAMSVSAQAQPLLRGIVSDVVWSCVGGVA